MVWFTVVYLNLYWTDRTNWLESCDSSNPEFRISLIHFHIGVVIHAPVWGATGTIQSCKIRFGVSIHAPVWGATSRQGQYWFRTSFNPRTRVGCDKCRIISLETKQVSIHAPVWGATEFEIYAQNGDIVSIHAPVWGATCYPWRQDAKRTCFNPRTRVGCDQFVNPTVILICVSIHAPVWGATSVMDSLLFCCKFQSTHPCGVRPMWRQLPQQLLMFQSTHPCGVRPVNVNYLCMQTCFNPRTRVGCDAPDVCIYSRDGVSIHAPVWGATSDWAWIWQSSKFQSTHPCGVRLKLYKPSKFSDKFQSTHPCGVRLQLFADKIELNDVSIRDCKIFCVNLIIKHKFTQENINERFNRSFAWRIT